MLLVDVHGRETLRTINYYLPPNVNVNPKHIFKSQPVPKVCCGDANAHNAVWSSELPGDAGGSESEEVIIESNLVVLNEYGPTRRALNGNEQYALTLHQRQRILQSAYP